MSAEKEFKKENMDFYLKEVAKEYRKQIGGKMPAEIIVVGGGAILARYGFRDVTQDIDAVLGASGAMKDAIRTVSNKYDLPFGWLNSDFIRTESYSPRLAEHSTHYRTFSNIVDVRIVEAEYLIAMKLKSGRIYKKDLSDVVGILAEHQKENAPITYEMIDSAVKNLYGSWDGISQYAVDVLQTALKIKDEGALAQLFQEVNEEEFLNKKAAINAQRYGEELNEDNVSEIIRQARARLSAQPKKQEKKQEKEQEKEPELH